MRSYPTINVKAHPDLRAWLEQRAKENARSLTGEVTWLLEQQRRADVTQLPAQGSRNQAAA